MTYIVSIASNHNHEENFEKIKKLISSQLSASNINYAEIILTQPIGTGYPPVPYYNTAVRFSSPFPMIEINERLKDIELSCGRTPEMKEKTGWKSKKTPCFFTPFRLKAADVLPYSDIL